MKLLLCIIMILFPALASAEWRHSNPNEMSVTHAKLGQILVNVQATTIDVSYTEGRIAYYLEHGNKHCRWVAMGEAHKTFKDDYTVQPPVTDFSRMLQWVAGHIGDGFTQAAEELMATEIGDTPVIWEDIEAMCSGIMP